jgi:hypothetical protein
MTMLVYAEALRFVYAFSTRWPGVLTGVGCWRSSAPRSSQRGSSRIQLGRAPRAG